VIEFGFKECIEEIQTLATVANRFIEPRSEFILKNLVSDLENVRAHPSETVVRWEIPEKHPLVTTLSEGAYERGVRGAENVTAELTSVWEIRNPPKPKKKGPPRTFVLRGIASTRVRVFRHDCEGNKHEIAMWRVEVGDRAAPGCCFHIQVLGEAEQPPFPHSLSIPRLPSILITPAAVFEYVLGELFQDEWRRLASEETAAIRTWRSLQASRLIPLLNWAVKVIEGCAGSPWMAFKAQYPPVDLFIEPS
jgi:hypothetical protein